LKIAIGAFSITDGLTFHLVNILFKITLTKNLQKNCAKKAADISTEIFVYQQFINKH